MVNSQAITYPLCCHHETYDSLSPNHDYKEASKKEVLPTKTANRLFFLLRMRSAETPKLRTNFAVKRVRNGSESSYKARRLLPYIQITREKSEEGKHKKETNIRVPMADREGALQSFVTSAEGVGLEVGQHDPTVRMLRVMGVGYGQSRRNPELEPGEALMQINDGKGNEIRFRLAIEPGFVDGEDREWDGRVIARIESAKFDGKDAPLTYEMRHEGFKFYSSGMPEMLERAKEGEQPTITVRQETPDSACFVDGHHASAGRRDLGCYCKEEREASLAIIHKRGGINSLMPGTGNGNGSEAQDIQIAVNNSRARRGLPTLPFPEVYGRMGLEGDKRNTTLKISTLLMEHLLRVKEIPNITTLTESRTKQNIWHEFGGMHTVMGESLNVTPVDHPDSQYKQSKFGYTRADQMPFPLQTI